MSTASEERVRREYREGPEYHAGPEHHDGPARHEGPVRSERSLGNLLKELRDETTLLMREEVTLAKTEVSEKISRVARNAGYLAGGSLVAFAGCIVLLFAAAAGLYIGLIAWDVVTASTALWLAPLIVAAIVMVIGYVMLHKAIQTLKREPAFPERTAKTVQDDTNWLKEKVSR